MNDRIERLERALRDIGEHLDYCDDVGCPVSRVTIRDIIDRAALRPDGEGGQPSTGVLTPELMRAFMEGSIQTGAKIDNLAAPAAEEPGESDLETLTYKLVRHSIAQYLGNRDNWRKADVADVKEVLRAVLRREKEKA